MRFLPLLIVALLLLAAGIAVAQDGDGDGIEDAQEDNLIQTYAPHLYFHPEEVYFPVSIQFALDTSVLERYNDSGPPILIDPNPTPASLAALDIPADPETSPGDVYYLNSTLGSIRDDSGILAAYEAGADSETVYAHVTSDGGQTVVQYWFFYAFNPGRWNNHEGDWEMIQVELSGGSPTGVAFSQHQHGQRMAWAEAHKEGDHPKVYVSKGSHSNYPRPYQGQLGIAGDQVSDKGPIWTPADYALVNVGESDNPLPGNEWLRFAGLWGEFYPQAYARAEAGPQGPSYRAGGAMFDSPTAWGSDLHVPSVYELFVDWVLANLWLIFIGLIAFSFVITILRLWRLHRKTGAGRRLWPYAHFLPFDRKSAAMVLAIIGLAVGLAGFFYPWYVVTLDVDAPGFLVTDGAVEFLQIGGTEGVLVNPMRAGATELIELVPLPLALMFVILTLYFLFRIGGTRTSGRMGAKFLWRAIVWVLPFALIYLFTSMLLVGLAGLDIGGIQPDVLLQPVAEDPLGGSVDLAYEGGSARIEWGLAFGSWLLFAGAGILFIAGILALSKRYTFYTAGS